MYDSFFQLIHEIFLTAVWYVTNFFKGIFMRLFHRAHTFNMSDVLGHGGEYARCQKCGIPLNETRPTSRRQKAFTFAAVAVLALAALSRADSFVGSQRDTTFFVDSVYTLKIVVTQGDCSPADPCAMQIASEGGSGTVFKNLFGSVGDTIQVPYNFPIGQFKPGAVRATLFFFGADGKTKDIWMVKLAYKDPKPPLGLRRRVAGFHAPGLKRAIRIDGRMFQ